MDQIKVFFQGREVYSKEGEMPSESSQIMREKKQDRGKKKRGNHGFRGRSSRHWMVVSIQASVGGSICQFLQIYTCFDCVVINH